MKWTKCYKNALEQIILSRNHEQDLGVNGSDTNLLNLNTQLMEIGGMTLGRKVFRIIVRTSTMGPSLTILQSIVNLWIMSTNLIIGRIDPMSNLCEAWRSEDQQINQLIQDLPSSRSWFWDENVGQIWVLY